MLNFQLGKAKNKLTVCYVIANSRWVKLCCKQSEGGDFNENRQQLDKCELTI